MHWWNQLLYSKLGLISALLAQMDLTKFDNLLSFWAGYLDVTQHHINAKATAGPCLEQMK